MHSGPAERTRQIGYKPRVNTVSVKSVAAERKQAELIGRFELGQTDGAVAAGDFGGKGVESEERERSEGVWLGSGEVRVLAVVDWGRGSGGGVVAASDEAEEEVERGGDDDGGGDDDDYDDY